MSKLCFGCMQQKESSPVCEHCGYDETKGNLPHQLPAGTLLKNQYLIGRVLGQGGFGITYLGWDQHLSVPVAIKEYFPHGAVQRHTQISTQVICSGNESPEVFARHRNHFLKEARILAQLSNIPEIVQVQNYFTENDTAYIVMEFVQGTTLKARLKQLGRPMTEEEALAIMEPVLTGLQKVHEHDLIHRDISPDNIMIPDNASPKLIDFGTVRYVGTSEASKSTENVLKPGFAPMEQYNTRGNMGPWTDVYAVCATFHYLLTEKVPPEVMERYDGDESLTLLRNTPGLSRKTIQALENGLKILAADRTQSIRELAENLYSEEAPEVPAAPKKRSFKIPALIGGCLAALAIGVGLLLPKKAAVVPETTAVTESVLAETTAPTTAPASGLREVEIRYSEAEALLNQGHVKQAAIAFGKLGNYRDSREQSFRLWSEFAPRETLIAAANHTVGIRTDGRVLAAGDNSYGQCNVEGWSDIIAVSASRNHTVGLRADGTVVATGCNEFDQCEVSGWTDVVAILAADDYGLDPVAYPGSYTLGIKSDGTVLVTGSNTFGQCDVTQWTDVVLLTSSTISWGGCRCAHTVGLRADGTVVAAGENTGNWLAPVSQWTDIVDVCTGGQHIVGLKSDGTTVYAASDIEVWGLYPKRYDASGWTDIVQIQAAVAFTFGLKSDGTIKIAGNHDLYNMRDVLRWKNIATLSVDSIAIGLRTDGTVIGSGYDPYGARNFSHWRDIVAIATSNNHTVGLRADGTVLAVGYNDFGQCDLDDWTDLVVPE